MNFPARLFTACAAALLVSSLLHTVQAADAAAPAGATPSAEPTTPFTSIFSPPPEAPKPAAAKPAADGAGRRPLSARQAADIEELFKALQNRAAAQSQAAASPTPTLVVLTQKGDTVDKIVARTLGHLPLRTDVLRKALIQRNPEVFPKGKVGRIPVGSTIYLPSHEDFRVAALGQQAKPITQVADTQVDERRGWIRFPQ